jgi:hypothetical protein
MKGMSERRSLLDEVPLAETLGTTGVSPQVSILWGLSNTSGKDLGNAPLGSKGRKFQAPLLSLNLLTIRFVNFIYFY